MFAYQKFKFFLMVPKGILQKFVVIVPAYYGLVQGKVKEIQVFLNSPIGNFKKFVVIVAAYYGLVQGEDK